MKVQFEKIDQTLKGWQHFLTCVGLLVTVNLSGCFNPPPSSTRGKTVSLRIANTVSITDTKSVSRYDPNSRDDTAMSAPTGALTGSSVTIPSGALNIAVDLIMEESVPLSETSMTSSVRLDAGISVTPVGSGMIIRPSEAADLAGRLTISLPTGFGASLNRQDMGLQSAPIYAVFYKQFVGTALQDGVIPTKDLRISSNGNILFEGYFGVYWLVKVSAPVEEKIEVAAEEPIVNIKKVTVIETTGVVPERLIQAKEVKPEVSWNSTTISYDNVSRTAMLIAEAKDSPLLSDCRADFYKSIADSGGTVVACGTRAEAKLSLSSPEARRLVGRFRCLDEEGRLTISPWSIAVDVPVFDESSKYNVEDLRVAQTHVQSREVLKVLFSAELTTSYPKFRLINTSSDATLFDLIGSPAAGQAYASKQLLSDGSMYLKLLLSPAGRLTNYVYGSNRLLLQSELDDTLLEVSFVVKDFEIFDTVATTSFSSNSQSASDGFQAWTSVLANPVVRDGGTGLTQLSNGMLNIVNPR